MNSQVNMHPHYTLPGVMHYLQTEFTRNERDRIAWELERSEMKARIAQLEGDNKDLQYQLVKLKNSNTNKNDTSVSIDSEDGLDLASLMKSKMAVQDNVKEIIYLFKSPNISTQLRSLNDKKDSVHELEKMNFNQSIVHEGIDATDVSDDIVNDVHQAEALQEAMNDRSQHTTQETSSDAATVVMNDETTNNTYNGVRPRRSSSLFTRAKVSAIDPSQGETSDNNNEDIRKASGLFRTDSQQVIKLKASQNQLLTFSKSGQLSLWYVDDSLKRADSPLKTFEGISSSLLDICWLDMNKFLILDDVGIKLFTSESVKPVSQLRLFTNGKTKNSKSNLVEYSDLLQHGFKNNAVLLAVKEQINVLQISISMGDLTPTIVEGKRASIHLQRKPLAVEFGMTEKSLIVLHEDPYEVVIYNFQGKLLQSISLKNIIPKDSETDIKPVLHLNKNSSKLLIQFQRLILIYSFDQKKVIVKYTLKFQAAYIIFKSAKDDVVIAYEDGEVELRNANNFDAIIEKFSSRNESNLSDSRIRAFDDTTVNSKYVVISNDSSDGIKINTLPEADQ